MRRARIPAAAAIAALLAIPAPLLAAAARADDVAGAKLLFAKTPGALDQAQRVAIFRQLGLRVSDDGTGLVDDTCGQPATAEVQIRDLNGDKVDEVLITYGNSCLSGMAGSSVAVFIRDKADRYQSQLGFPGVLAEVRPAKGGGYPDLLIGGPGFCFPVWRWNGAAYAHAGDEPQQPGGCDKR
jgi:hypothetical protein